MAARLIGKVLLQPDADTAFDGRRLERRIVANLGRNGPTVIVDIARKQMQRAVRTGGGDDVFAHGHNQLAPLRIKRIEAVENDVGAFGRPDQALPVHGIGGPLDSFGRQAISAARAGDGDDLVTGRVEGLGCGMGNAPVGAENGDAWHGSNSFEVGAASTISVHQRNFNQQKSICIIQI